MNMITQKEFQLRARTRGCHLVTDEVARGLGALPEVGVLHLLLKHTSAGLCLNENWDADVRHDMNEIFNHLVPENQPYFKHTLEGSDDMPAHVGFGHCARFGIYHIPIFQQNAEWQECACGCHAHHSHHGWQAQPRHLARHLPV